MGCVVSAGRDSVRGNLGGLAGRGALGATQREAGERFATIVTQNARGYSLFRLSRAPPSERTAELKHGLSNILCVFISGFSLRCKVKLRVGKLFGLIL